MAETNGMTEFTEERIPESGIETAIGELVELYGGTMKERRDRAQSFVLPLRRGSAQAGGVECTLSWAPSVEGEATVTLTCDRDVDAPKGQRVAMLLAGVIGSFLFMLWPFFPGERAYGTLAWLGGAVAIAVYVMSLRKTSRGIAYDFLQRLAARQRAE